jgi:hypothetical protein
MKNKLLKTFMVGISIIAGATPLVAQSNNALNFDGVDDNIQITHFNRPDTLTIEAWVKNTSQSGERDILSWGTSAGGNTSEFLQNGDSVYYAEWNGTLETTSFRADISDGNWHHIAITRNGNGPNNVSIYRDGVLLGTNSINSSGPTNDLRIGAENYTALQRFYSGTLDELRVWGYAKTQTKIQADMNYELAGTEPGLIFMYHFNQGIANGNNSGVTTLVDSGPNNNSGTLNNFALNGTTSNWVGNAPVLCVPSYGTDTRTECNSYTWIDGNTYTADTLGAMHTIANGAANGCDSLVTLDLTIINSATGTDTRTECTSYTWIDGNTYTASNNTATFNIVSAAANGCDSLVTLDLTIINSATGTDTKTECNSYTWIDGNTYTASNNTATFNIVGGAANGCDSLVTLDLTIINSATGTDTRTECNSYTWIDGNTYTASNNTATFNIVSAAANGCDSLVTLDLTIINSATGTDTRTECNSYTWIDGDTSTASNYTATFNIVGGAANGCDSLVTLDLTITNSATGTDTRTECNSYTWIDGDTYTASNNTATFNIVSAAANGCDSLVTLDLTIKNVSDLTTSTSGTTISSNNSSATYQWLDCDNNNSIISGETSASFIASTDGNYAVELTENGCIDTSACVAITSTVGILENNFGNEFKLYPNPTDGEFSIDLGMNYESSNVRLTDINGKLIQLNSYNNSQFLNLKLEEPAGVYLLVIESTEKKVVIRLVKE